jgi:hypothetical protein
MRADVNTGKAAHADCCTDAPVRQIHTNAGKQLDAFSITPLHVSFLLRLMLTPNSEGRAHQLKPVKVEHLWPKLYDNLPVLATERFAPRTRAGVECRDPSTREDEDEDDAYGRFHAGDFRAAE